MTVAGGHIMARCATGMTQLLAAPPAGFLNAIVSAQVKNAHATLALTYRLSDALGDFFGPSGNNVAAGSLSVSSAVPGLSVSTDSAVSITVGGAGSPAEVLVEWHRIPKPTGWAVGGIVLTPSYQDIPNVVPAAGLVRARGPLEGPETGLAAVFVWNGDSTSIQTGYRLVRDGVTFDWVNGPGGGSVSTTPYARSSFAAQLVLQPGDILQTKVASIVTPGTAFLRVQVEKMAAV